MAENGRDQSPPAVPEGNNLHSPTKMKLGIRKFDFDVYGEGVARGDRVLMESADKADRLFPVTKLREG